MSVCVFVHDQSGCRVVDCTFGTSYSEQALLTIPNTSSACERKDLKRLAWSTSILLFATSLTHAIW